MESIDNCLLLGMAWTEYNPKIYIKKKNRIYGQAKRDRIRLVEMSKHFNINCYTLDNKHDKIMNKHIFANFNSPRRIQKIIDRVFNNHPIFKWIILDYFFSPVL